MYSYEDFPKSMGYPGKSLADNLDPFTRRDMEKTTPISIKRSTGLGKSYKDGGNKIISININQAKYTHKYANHRSRLSKEEQKSRL